MQFADKGTILEQFCSKYVIYYSNTRENLFELVDEEVGS